MARPTGRYQGCSTPNDQPAEGLVSRLSDRLTPVGTEQVSLAEAAGRVLAQPITADRDNPPVDVSAMDGYALRLGDVSAEPMTVAGEVLMGKPPPAIPDGHAVKVFTGGAVPAGTEAVVRREFTSESPGQVIIDPDAPDLKPGMNIRGRGENCRRGQVVCEPGRVITAARVSALASFGLQQVEVHHNIKAAVVITGDELRQPGQAVADTAIRDSNGPAIEALLASSIPNCYVTRTHAPDDPDRLRDQLKAQLDQHDILITTGGVSMGDHDYVPDVIQELGGEVMYHGLPIRPGRPMLGAIGPQGQLILGLPGNPLSVLVTLTRFGLPMVYKLAGGVDDAFGPGMARLTNPDDKTLGLDWYRLVRSAGRGEVELIPSRGSGDVPSLAGSGGFIEQPADTQASEHVRFWKWS